MRKLINLFLSFAVIIMSLVPAQAASRNQCLAVFCNPEFECFWPDLNPDVLKVATGWEQFDEFLIETKAKANGRDIVIDLDLHGDKYAIIQYQDFRTHRVITSGAGMGYICNHIEKILGSDHVVLIYEGCYAGEVYNHSIRGNKQGENHPGTPTFPIYGGSYNYSNINNLIYMQYVTGCLVWFEDLRKYENFKGPKRADDNDPIYIKMTSLYRILGSLYKPILPEP